MPLIVVLIGLTTPFLLQSAPTGTQSPSLHVLRIVGGPAGKEVSGTFVLDEERSAFNRAVDREVIVHFQWEGVPGPHKLEARWRSPDGSYTSNSVVDYVAKSRRFGAYWTLTIGPSMQLGTWSIEAAVDGEPAGRFTFEITDANVAPGAAPRRPLSEQELYDRLAPEYVQLERLLPGGREAEPAGGVLFGPTLVLTSLRALDSVDRVKQVRQGGVAVEIATVIAAHRPLGWVLLPGSVEGGTRLQLAEPPRVGDACYTMQSEGPGGRVLVPGRITGLTPAGSGAVPGWIATFINGLGTLGAPVVDRYGDLIGILGTSAGGSLDLSAFRPGATIEFGNIPVISARAVNVPSGAAPVALAELRARGIVLEPLVGTEHVVSGGFASQIARGTTTVRVDQQRQEFRLTDKEITIFVTLSPAERLRALGGFQVFDAASRRIAESKPGKLNLPKQNLVLFSAKIAVPSAAGTYRAEFHLDGKPAWRGYFKVIE